MDATTKNEETKSRTQADMVDRTQCNAASKASKASLSNNTIARVVMNF
jgi:hypothetical protein